MEQKVPDNNHSALFYVIVQPIRFSLNENCASLIALIDKFAKKNVESVLKVPCEIRVSPFYSNASTTLIGRVKSINTRNSKKKGKVCHIITINFDYQENAADRINFIASKFLPRHGAPGGSRDYSLVKTKLEFFQLKVKKDGKDKKRAKTKTKK
mgnify:CR=1 FL=1